MQKLAPGEVFAATGSSPRGLSSAEAVLRLTERGRNEVPRPRRQAMGKQARQRVHNGFLGTRSLLQYIALFEGLVTGQGRPAEVSEPSGYA